MKCPVCGKPILPPGYSYGRFCSKPCYKLQWCRDSRGWKPVSEKSCIICGNSFLPSKWHPTSVTCSYLCHKKYDYRNHRRERIAQGRRYNASHRAEHAAKSKEWRRLNPLKAWARSKVSAAIRSGKLIRPEVCPSCGAKGNIEAHHFNGYNNPLDIKWLCFTCHRRLHGKLVQ